MNIRGNKGYTMLEMMLSISLMTIVIGALWVLADSLETTSQDQEAIISTQGEVTTAMMRISRELRSASFSTIPWGADDTLTAISYQVAEDVDGNGVAVDVGGNLELGAARRIFADTGDANNDGRTDQVLLFSNNNFTVLMNNLMPDEDVNDNDVLDAGEDTNFNNRLDRGVLFTNTGTRVQVMLQAQRQAGPRARPMLSTMVETIDPRN